MAIVTTVPYRQGEKFLDLQMIYGMGQTQISPYGLQPVTVYGTGDIP